MALRPNKPHPRGRAFVRVPQRLDARLDQLGQIAL
jgi:hypothetical protein